MQGFYQGEFICLYTSSAVEYQFWKRSNRVQSQNVKKKKNKGGNAAGGRMMLCDIQRRGAFTFKIIETKIHFQMKETKGGGIKAKA